MEHLRDVPDPPFKLLCRQPPRMQRKRHVIVNGEVRIENVRLKNEGDIARRRGFIVDRDTVQVDFAFFGFIQTGDAAECRRLPRAGLPE